jgi:hypothetical protein
MRHIHVCLANTSCELRFASRFDMYEGDENPRAGSHGATTRFEDFGVYGPADDKLNDDVEGSRLADKILSPRFPQTAPIDEVVPR